MKTINREIAKVVLDELFNEVKGFLEFRFISNEGKIQRRFYRIGDAIDWEEVERLNQSGFNIYFGACPRSKEAGKRENVSSCHFLWVDLDSKDFDPNNVEKGKVLALERMNNVLPENHLPTITISTGHGYHLYWRLKGAVTENLETVENIMAGLAKRLGGDHVQDISRVLRLPGTYNMKDPDNPLLCEIIDWKVGRLYDLNDLAEYQIDNSVIGRAASVSFATQLKKIDLSNLQVPRKIIDLIKNGKQADDDYASRSEADFAVICALARHHSDDDILAVYSDADFKIGAKFRERGSGLNYLKHSIASARGCILEEQKSEQGIQKEEPLQIHLVDLERSELIGKWVSTDIWIAGVGDPFFAPKEWTIDCGNSDECKACPRRVKLQNGRELIDFCYLNDAQKLGCIRRYSGCTGDGYPDILEHCTITELLAVPLVGSEVEITPRDYRDKNVFYLGNIVSSNRPYRAIGQVIGEPKKQKCSLLITELRPLKTVAEAFELTPSVVESFLSFQPKENTLESHIQHAEFIARDISNWITKIYGDHRRMVLLAMLLVYHSPIQVSWDGEDIKGTLDLLVIGDTGQGKSRAFLRFMKAVELGKWISGNTASRTGILYHLDTKINERRILRYGAFPLAHGEQIAIDEAQTIPMDQWAEMTNARSEGILKIDRVIRGEHPCRVRLICFANPLNNKPMSQFQFGIEVVASENSFLKPADLRRFDLLGIVTASDQSVDDILPSDGQDSKEKQLFSSELLRQSILWTWTRKKEDFIYGDGSVEAVRESTKSLVKKYELSDIPLLISDTHEKIIRLGFSFAALFHHTDDYHQRIVLTSLHVQMAERFIDYFYSHPNCAFDQYVHTERLNTSLSDEEYRRIYEDFLVPASNRQDVIGTEDMFKLFRQSTCISKSDISASTGLGDHALNDRIRQLREHRLIISGKGGYRKTQRMITFLKRWTQEIAGDTPSGSA